MYVYGFIFYYIVNYFLYLFMIVFYLILSDFRSASSSFVRMLLLMFLL